MGWSTAGCKSHSSFVILLSLCEIYVSSSLKLYSIVYNIFKVISFFFFFLSETLSTVLQIFLLCHFLRKALSGCNFVRFQSHDPSVSWRWARTTKFSIREDYDYVYLWETIEPYIHLQFPVCWATIFCLLMLLIPEVIFL